MKRTHFSELSISIIISQLELGVPVVEVVMQKLVIFIKKKKVHAVGSLSHTYIFYLILPKGLFRINLQCVYII